MDKCKHMQVRHELSTSYTLINTRTPLEITTVEKDLGIFCSNTLSPSLQCHKATSNAMRSLGLIKRTFKYLSLQSLPFLYKTYIRPHLEYCVPVWSPYLMGDMDEMEKVQHRSTKLVREISCLPYKERLKILHLPSLCARRLRGDLIETFKILKGFTDTRDAPNMLKNLPIIPSRTSQNLSLLFFKIPPIIPKLFCSDSK